jgi:hypothetical protein
VRLVANSIAVVDPKSGRPVGDVPLPFSPSDVDAGGDDIWVLNEPSRTATAIDPSTLKIAQTVGLDGDPSSQYAAGGTEWVGLAGGAVDKVDSNGVTKIPLWRPPSIRANQAPCFVYVTGDRRGVWVSQGQNVAVLSAASGSILRKLRLPPATDAATTGGTCYGLRYSGGHMLAIQNPDQSIGPVDLNSNSYTPIATDPSLVTITFGSANWAAGFGSDWIITYTVSTTGRQVNFLERLDPVSGDVTNKLVLAVGGTVATDPASGVWIVDGRALVHVDPTSGQITDTTRLHHRPCCPWGAVGNGLAVGQGRLWVALDSP